MYLTIVNTDRLVEEDLDTSLICLRSSTSRLIMKSVRCALEAELCLDGANPSNLDIVYATCIQFKGLLV